MRPIPFILALIVSIANGCILCPYRIPPIPRPLDQIQLPSAEKLVEMSDGLIQLCENKTRLSSVSEPCRSEVTKLVCSFNVLLASYNSKCPSGAEDTEECARCQRTYAHNYAKTSWVQIWLDSFGKMPSGISEGNYHWLGDYEQCEGLKSAGHFNGRYCLVDFAIPSTASELICDHNQALEVSLGACLPAGCSTEESIQLVQHVTRHSVHIRCEPRGQWSTVALAIACVIVGWVALLWVATFVHWWVDLETLPPTGSELVLSLSLQRNASDSMRTKRTETLSFHAAQGIQVLSVFLLASGYVFYLAMPYLENPMFAYEFSSQLLYQPLMNFSFYVDGLLALSALRLALKPASKFATFPDLLKQLFRRFSRTWPAYAVITLFISTVYDRLGEGPMWSHNDLSKRCTSNWWANILFINNLLSGEMICLDTGFLIVLEAQLFVFGATLLYLATRYRRPMIYSALALCVTSIFYTFVTTYRARMYGTLIPTKNVVEIDLRENCRLQTYGLYVSKVYVNPLGRLAPYLLGLLMPLCFERNFPKLLTAFFYAAITILCWLIAALIVWGPYYFLQVGAAQLWQSAYASLHRSAWAIIVLFAAYSLDNASHKNLRNTILSWRVFYPLGKLTYLVFLISEPVAISLFASLHRPIYLTAGSAVLTCIGCVLFSYLVAFLIDIAISRPFRHLLDLTLSRFCTPA